MSRPQRKRRLKREKRFRALVWKAWALCNTLGPGLTRHMLERVFRRKAGIVLLPAGWQMHAWLEGGTIALLYGNPNAFKFDKPVPLIVNNPMNHADLLLATRIYTA